MWRWLPLWEADEVRLAQAEYEDALAAYARARRTGARDHGAAARRLDASVQRLARAMGRDRRKVVIPPHAPPSPPPR